MKPLWPLALLLIPAHAWGFQLQATAGGLPVRWPGPVQVEVALADGPIAAGEAARVVERAAATWNAALPAGAAAGTLTVVAHPGPAGASANDGHNVVRWIPAGWHDDFGEEQIAVTQLSYGASSGRIYDADILINAEDFAFTTGGACTGAYDLESVLTHEVGHLLGLSHENGNPAATMYGSAAPCETGKRDLDEDDIAGVRALYAEVAAPAASPAPALTSNPTAPTQTVTTPAPISQHTLGCAIDPGARHGGAGLVALLLVVASLVLARRRFLVALAATLALASSAALATTSHGLTLAELGGRADLIARGTVVASRAVQLGDRIYTDVELATTELWKGHAGAHIILRQLGGELGGRVLAIEGQPALAVGEEVVVFVARRTDGAFRLVGLSQGAFHLVHAGGATYALRDQSGLVLAGPDGRLAPGGLEACTLGSLYRSSRP